MVVWKPASVCLKKLNALLGFDPVGPIKFVKSSGAVAGIVAEYRNGVLYYGAA